MNFVTLRDRTLTSKLGHVIDFKKGEPTYVPPEVWDEAIAIGATPEDELPEEDKTNSTEPNDPVERKAAIQAAFQAIVERGAREDFAASGAPSGKAVNKQLGWTVESRERLEAWNQYVTAKAA